MAYNAIGCLVPAVRWHAATVILSASLKYASAYLGSDAESGPTPGMEEFNTPWLELPEIAFRVRGLI